VGSIVVEGSKSRILKAGEEGKVSLLISWPTAQEKHPKQSG